MPEEFTPEALWAQFGEQIIAFGLRALGAIVVLIIGMRIAGWLGNLVKRTALQRDSIDDTLGNFFGSIVRWIFTAGVFIAVLQMFGVQATSFVAILGAMTLAIGLSMQGALGNIASGLMIMMFRPYKLQDYIEVAGVGGTVKDINLFQTILATSDNIKLIIPNSQAIDGVIKNYTGYRTRRVDVVFGIDYDDDMDQALGILNQIVDQHDRILPRPEPFVKVTNLGDSSVDITIRVWARVEDYWGVKFDLIKDGKSAFDAAGISIPYPHQVIVQKNAS